MDSIFIDRLEVFSKIGITEAERAKPQQLHVSVELSSDTTKAAASDNVNDTIDYEAVCNSIKNLATTERRTVEKFTEDIAQNILQEFAPHAVSVRITKFILSDTSGVGVSITRP